MNTSSMHNLSNRERPPWIQAACTIYLYKWNERVKKTEPVNLEMACSLARSSGYKDCELWEEPFAGLAVSISACSMCETSYACLSRVLIDSSDPVRYRWRCTIYSFHDFDLMIVCLLMVFWQSYSQTYATEELVAPASHNCIGYEIGTPFGGQPVIGLDKRWITRIKWLLAEMCLLGYSQWEFHFKLISCHMIKNDDMTVI